VRPRPIVILAITVAILGGVVAPVAARDADRSPSPGPELGRSHAGAARDDRNGHGRGDWRRALDRLVEGEPVSVAIGNDGRWLYRHLAFVPRIPASNEKLLLSTAMLERFAPETVLATTAMAKAPPVEGVVPTDLWIVGSGDPEVGLETMSALADQLVAAGLVRVEGSVMGSIGPFSRDWWAVGWRDYFDEDEVPFPTALTFRGNVGPRGGHIDDPEARAATALTRELERRGVKVAGAPGMGRPPRPLTQLATVDSLPLIDLLHAMNIDSLNFHAEVLGKVLGAAARGQPGSIAKGASAIDEFTAAHGAPGFRHHDASGLSYANRVTTRGIVRLLWGADQQPWGELLREALPTGGEGTLEDRLPFVKVRAKTGTLSEISALSGWVWLRKGRTWAEFSIVSNGISKTAAVHIEDKIVRLVSRAVALGG
jgi:serine-type D-Ala-D-Ala carboxypeptidase/endopeptidase (penicillin-binding protein 4)